MKKFIAEFLGTAIIVLSGCIASVSVNIMVSAVGFQIPMAFTTLTCAFSFGLAVMVSYYCFSRISGGHFNPAVSLGMLITGDITPRDFVGYAVSQIIGGICGACIAALMLDTRTAMFACGFDEFSTFGISMISAIIADVIFTFIFVYLFLSVVKNPELKHVSGLIIGLGFTLIYLAEVPMTGGSSNPARAIAAALIQEGGASLAQLWVFVIAPLLGAALAALTYIFINAEKVLPIETTEFAVVEEICDEESISDEEDDVIIEKIEPEK